MEFRWTHLLLRACLSTSQGQILEHFRWTIRVSWSVMVLPNSLPRILFYRSILVIARQFFYFKQDPITSLSDIRHNFHGLESQLRNCYNRELECHAFTLPLSCIWIQLVPNCYGFRQRVNVAASTPLCRWMDQSRWRPCGSASPCGKMHPVTNTHHLERINPLPNI